MNSSVISDKEVKAPARSSRAAWLKRAREWHLYLGTFFAPSILFFALTGAFQLFGLHESHAGETYQAPVWMQKLGALHKNQNLAVKKAPPAGFAAAPKPPQTENRPRNEPRRNSKFTVVLKWFFLGTAIGLVLTTGLGIYMAFKFNRSRVVTWSLLIAGTGIPAALIAMMV